MSPLFKAILKLCTTDHLFRKTIRKRIFEGSDAKTAFTQYQHILKTVKSQQRTRGDNGFYGCGSWARVDNSLQSNTIQIQKKFLITLQSKEVVPQLSSIKHKIFMIGFL